MIKLMPGTGLQLQPPLLPNCLRQQRCLVEAEEQTLQDLSQNSAVRSQSMLRAGPPQMYRMPQMHRPRRKLSQRQGNILKPLA